MALMNLCPSSSILSKPNISSPLPKLSSSSSPALPLYSPFLHNSSFALVIQSYNLTPIKPKNKICCAVNDNWGNRPPKETILLPGCDYEHWLIVMEFPKEPKPSSEDMVNTYIKTLAQVVGSEEEAKKRIYALSTTTYTGFQAQISEELSEKCKGLPGVLWVLPDSYIDVPNKDYGGDKFVDGKVIPRPQPRPSERLQPPRRNYNRQQAYQKQRYERRRDGQPRSSVKVEERNNSEASTSDMVETKSEGQ